MAQSKPSLTLRIEYAALALGLTVLFLLLAGNDDALLADVADINNQQSSTTKSTKAPPSSGIAATQTAQPTKPDLDDAARFKFAREGILGTSFDLTVVAENRTLAQAAEKRILEEISQRESIINTYVPESEVSRINRMPITDKERIEISYSLWLLLRSCLDIQDRSDGAFNVYIGDALSLWHQASTTGKPPTSEALEAAVPRSSAGFRTITSNNRKYLRRYQPGSFNFNAIGKGYILDKAIREAVAEVPQIKGLMLNLGGDVKVWNHPSRKRTPWRVPIADPRNPADNAPPLAEVELPNLAIATSGNYARQIKVGSHSHNHILDARTGLPAEEILSATVIAPTGDRADALATALCAMPVKEGLAMIEKQAAACLIVDKSGKQHRSTSFRSFEVSDQPNNQSAWPDNFLVRLDFELARSDRYSSFNRHFVGAWVEDNRGRRIRILALWAANSDIHYTRNLDTFWRQAWLLAGEGTKTSSLRQFSRATRGLGKYSLRWDGRDDQGRAVPQGAYTLHLDVNRENGPPRGREVHTHTSIELDCGNKPVSIKAADKPELRNVRATYTPEAPN